MRAKTLLKTLLFLISIAPTCDASDQLKNPFLKHKAILKDNSAKNTFIFWVNGDSDRFRHVGATKAENVRVDSVEVERIKTLLGDCECNAILFHDQRGSDRWYTNQRHFGSFFYAYSNGNQVRFEYVKRVKNRDEASFKSIKKHKTFISFKETKQDSTFLANLLKASSAIFPHTRLHLVYRGHSFSHSIGSFPTFDYSHKESQFHLNEFMNGVESSNIKFATVTFAACSMSNIAFAQKLSQYAKYMIATQVNIYESVDTGFSFEYLKKINDRLSISEISNLIGRGLLERFDQVHTPQLFMREYPVSVINLEQLSEVFSEQFTSTLMALKQEIQNFPQQYLSESIKVTVSKRYIMAKKIVDIATTP